MKKYLILILMCLLLIVAYCDNKFNSYDYDTQINNLDEKFN